MPGHSFYVKDIGFVHAGDLEVGTILVVDGEEVIRLIFDCFVKDQILSL
jgi:hypothetical protein